MNTWRFKYRLHKSHRLIIKSRLFLAVFVMNSIIPVLCLALLVCVAHGASTGQSDPCPGVICEGGCCIQPGYICCKEGVYCAKPGHCPDDESLFKVQLTPPSKLGSSACKGTTCPSGCCEEGANWACCPDGDYCAKTPADCPNFGYNNKHVLI